MSRSRLALLVPLLLLSACARAPKHPEPVNHEERALAMAHAAWADTFARRADPSYSPQNVQRFAPYRVTLEKGIWRVRTAAEARVHGRAPSAVILANDGTTYIASSER